MHNFRTFRTHLSLQKRLYMLGIVIIAPLLFTNCGNVGTSKQAGLVPTAVAQSPIYTVEQQFNVSYGPLPQERLNLCIPKGALGRQSAVIIIHGGAWIGGDNSTLQSECIVLAEHGFVAANVNYRLARPSIKSTQ